MTTPVAAVVLASRGGARLASTMRSVDWAAERLVLDPAGRLDGQGSVRDLEQATGLSSPWLLLLQEGEIVSAALAEEIAKVVGGAGALDGYRIAEEAQALGATFLVRSAPVRLTRRGHARLVLASDLTAELHVSGRVGRLDARLAAGKIAALASAVDDVDADAGALAAVLHASGGRARLRHLVLGPIVPAARALSARGPARALWPRWALAVLRGFRAQLVYAKIWEMQREEAARPR